MEEITNEQMLRIGIIKVSRLYPQFE